nr:uncharacterized protein LOC113735569 [Coffea arabica]
MGDFNEVLTQEEFQGATWRPNWQIMNFRKALSDCNLFDLGHEGNHFTWCRNRSAPDTTRARLDRACVSHDFLTLFPDARIYHSHALFSDHVPIVLRLSCSHDLLKARSKSRRDKCFMFEAMWIKSEDCERIIQDSWEYSSTEDACANLVMKTNSCRLGLLQWSKQSFGNHTKAADDLWQRISRLQQGVLTDSIKAEISSLTTQLEELLDKQDIMWKQRSKAQWYREGDRNTAYFHGLASQRRKHNQIVGLFDNNGSWCQSQEGLESIIMEHFGTIFSTSQSTSLAIDAVIQRVRGCVSKEMNYCLLRTYTTIEVTKALSQMHPFKSPGPDGMSPVFYQRYWHIVGRDVTRWVLTVLNEGTLPTSLNHTYVVLIPKCHSPSSITQFRPISLCNVVYKLASKVLANRLRNCLPKVISPCQSAFIPGRCITDNILIAYEVNHSLKLKSYGQEGLMSIKLDMSKAFDKVEWLFLRHMMIALGFHSAFVDIVFRCISTVSYTFLLNGSQLGNLQPHRGIRQGDPLSPYLFLICAEGFSCLLQEAERCGSISASGQEVNFDKSAVVFSKNTDPTERIWQRIHGWNEQRLSTAGKEIMIKAVVQAIPTYSMSCFKYPDSLLSDIQSMISNFWWGDGTKQRPIHWVSWNRMCSSKNDGGMGFRQLKAFNLALLAKQAWRIATQPSTLLHQVFKAKYFPTKDFFHDEPTSRPSFTWRGLCVVRRYLLSGSRWRVGNGNHVRIWKDRWIPRPSTFKIISRYDVLLDDSTVDCLIDGNSRKWKVELLQELFWHDEIELIMGIPLGDSHNHDKLIWHYSKNGSFTVKSAYHLIKTQSTGWQDVASGSNGSVQDIWPRLWKLNIPNKVKIFLWRICKGILPTSSTLNSRGVHLDPMCLLCKTPVEDVTHLFLCCPVAVQAWALSFLTLKIRLDSAKQVSSWLPGLLNLLKKQDMELVAIILWNLWLNRNGALFDGSYRDPLSLVSLSINFLQKYREANTSPNTPIRTSIAPLHWTKPPVGFLKANFDGAVFSEYGYSGVGVVVRDERGNFVTGTSHKISGIFSPEVIEAYAARTAISLLLQWKVPNIILEGDSLKIVNMLKLMESDDSAYGVLLDDIFVRLQNFAAWEANWVPRKANVPAHLLARNARSISDICSWSYSPPPFLPSAISADLSSP